MGETQAQQGSGRDERPRQGKEGEEGQGRKPGTVEWILGGASAVLVVAMCGTLLYEALSATSSKPELNIAVERIEAVREGFRVEFRAINQGGGTAAAVNVEGQLRSGGQTIETSEVTLDYVPAHSQTKGGLLFNRDPSRYQLQVEAKSYKNP